MGISYSRRKRHSDEERALSPKEADCGQAGYTITSGFRRSLVNGGFALTLNGRPGRYPVKDGRMGSFRSGLRREMAQEFGTV